MNTTGVHAQADTRSSVLGEGTVGNMNQYRSHCRAAETGEPQTGTEMGGRSRTVREVKEDSRRLVGIGQCNYEEVRDASLSPRVNSDGVY